MTYEWSDITGRWSPQQFTELVWMLAQATVNSAPMYDHADTVLAALLRSAQRAEQEHQEWCRAHGWTPPHEETVDA